ncbi:putative eukaryotic initiation factor-2A [Besnoitia besnoiti]|uniref:Putative eukaryotic initiation factor-2A n=1 Tax=Besnoitia besnoiti TaxID=94643 RepID=A0A2A9M5M9_BESBE|nr:putative eukaryotic initiation factor-2A [Besnoitia besnoiti]PFH33265.1 putative eukaryotic initiation factor-2A [Besnoitia besnoiti]
MAPAALDREPSGKAELPAFLAVFALCGEGRYAPSLRFGLSSLFPRRTVDFRGRRPSASHVAFCLHPSLLFLLRGDGSRAGLAAASESRKARKRVLDSQMGGDDGFGPAEATGAEDTSKMEKEKLLPIEFLALTKDGAELYRYEDGMSLEEIKRPLKTIEGVEQAIWTEDGKNVVLVRKDAPNRVDVVSLDEDKTLFSCEGASTVVKFDLSPRGTFLYICFRHEAAQHENFCLYRMSDGEKVLSFTLKQINANTWPPLRWTSQESFCCRTVTNEVHIFKDNAFNLNHPHDRIRCEGVICVSPCNEKKKTAAAQEDAASGAKKDEAPMTCALFVGGKKGAPSSVKLFDLNDGNRCIATKSFFQGNEAAFKWCYDGRAVLALVHTDASEKSYYGSDALYFLRADGTYDCQLMAAEEGPIHDVQWSPSTLEFVLCKGPMPPEVLLYDGSKKPSAPKLSFGRMMRNTLRWDPFARLLVAGGFGNLAGDVDIWHKQQKKVIAKAQAPFTVTCDFTPDGLHFVAATTSPRLRVDNRITIYSVTGHALCRLDFAALYRVLIRPLAPSVAATLGQKQSRLLQSFLADPTLFLSRYFSSLSLTASSSAGSPAGRGFADDGARPALGSTGAPKARASPLGAAGAASQRDGAPRGVYRPPGSTGALAARLRAERQATVNSTNAASSVSRASAAPQTSIPGLAQKFPPGYSPPGAAAKAGGAKSKRK